MNPLLLVPSARSAVLVVLFLVLPLSLPAQSLKDPSVEGVIFYREHPSADSPLTAWPIEYHAEAGNGKIVMVITKQGQHLRLISDQVAATIPYPGRGGLTREQGIMLCDDALGRFPRHAQLLLNIRQAWEAVTPQDYVTHAVVSANRQSQIDLIIQRIADQAEIIQRQTANTITAPFVSLLDKLKPAAPKEPDDAKANSTDDGTQKASEPTNVEQSLDAIKAYYKSADDLEKPGP